jgi:hypothetical protein
MSSDNLAIRVRNLIKKYQIGGPKEKYLTLRHVMVSAAAAPPSTLSLVVPLPATSEFGTLKSGLFGVRRRMRYQQDTHKLQCDRLHLRYKLNGVHKLVHTLNTKP